LRGLARIAPPLDLLAGAVLALADAEEAVGLGPGPR
jgi:hypothetical protein